MVCTQADPSQGSEEGSYGSQELSEAWHVSKGFWNEPYLYKISEFPSFSGSELKLNLSI